MSIRAMPSAWNAVEMAMRGLKRSSAHSRTVHGSSPSNSTDSSPASSSSKSSVVLILLLALRARRRRPREAMWGAHATRTRSVSSRFSLLVSLPALVRLDARERAQLVVGEPPLELREALAVEAGVEPAADEPLDRLVQALRRDAPEERAPDRGAGAERAADE